MAIKFDANFKNITWSFLNIELVSPSHLSSHAVHLSGHILHIFGGYEANEALISTKPATSSTMLVIDLLRKVAISKVDSAEHATAGHSLVRLSGSVFLIGGGTQKEILLFTKFMPSADLCDLADNCIINNTSVTSPISWLKCEGVCERWIHQVCTGLRMIPKEKYICRDCKKTSKKRNVYKHLI